MNTTPLEKDPKFLTRTISCLTDQIDLFETFQDLSLKIISKFDLEAILTTFCDIVQEVMNYKMASIYLYNDTNDRFYLAYPKKEPTSQKLEDYDEKGNLPEDKIVNWVMKQGRWTVITEFDETQTNSIISLLPIRSPKKHIGFMVIETQGKWVQYNEKVGSILNFLASQTAIAIENQQLYTKVNHSNAYMSDMIESISNGIMAVDTKGQVTLVNKNATAILGIKKKKLTGVHYDGFLDGNVKREIDHLLTLVMKKGYALESMVNHSPYKEVNIRIGITATLLTDKYRETIGAIFIFRDMTASKEIERLTRLDEMKSEFVSNVSHELRTPLSIIKSYSEALLTQVKPDDFQTREKFLTVIDNETDRLSTIVTNLLDLSKIEAGKFHLNYSKFSIEEVIHSIITAFKPKTQKMSVLTEFDSALPLLNADEDKIREVLLNLVANSIKFSPEGGIINISVEQNEDVITCSVSDTGIGMHNDKLKHIFKKFYRVDNSDTYEIEGTGLGLSIVKHIIESHKGKISVESIFGKGSVFTFSLPLLER